MDNLASPIAETAFYCLGARMMDAQSTHPLCNDQFAHLFMDEHGKKIFSRFKSLTRANISSAARSRIVEDLLRDRLMNNVKLQIILVGAGFDTKAFRIAGGNWIEIDEAPIIERKNAKLPVEKCPNPLKRIAIDFSKKQLPSILKDCDQNKETIFVIEGVFMYLKESEIHELLKNLKNHFPRHTLICDLMSSVFIKKYMTEFVREIRRFNCVLKFLHESPRDIFQNNGYRVQKEISIPGRAIELKGFKIPWLLLNTYYARLLTDYSIYSFNSIP